MTAKPWFVGPSKDWVQRNQNWTLPANLPDTPRCLDTLANQRCELVSGHNCEHMLTIFPTPVEHENGPTTQPTD